MEQNNGFKEKSKRTRTEHVKPKATSEFHGDENNKKFLQAPQYIKNTKNHQNFIPKKWVYTFNGHSKGVQKVKFFPNSGHLILSASHDGTCKIWDTANKKCLRTYMGHQKSIRDIEYSKDGRRFLSASYDRSINLWDTEYGKVIHTFGKGTIPYCVKFHPNYSQ